MSAELAEIARRAASGDAAAAEALARACGPIAFRVARAAGLGEHDAEDLAQDVLLRLVGMLDGYDPQRAAPETLVYRMTLNAAADARARAGRRESRAATAVLDSAADPRAAAPGDGLAAADLRRLITAAAMELPERQRRVFLLHDLEGLGAAETAAAMGITETNVRVHLCAARRALRRRLAHLLEG